MKKNKIQWFRNVFVPNASDDTIVQLIFLYEKHCNPENISDSEKEYISELKKLYEKEIED